MILCDTAMIVAAIHEGDRNYVRAIQTLASVNTQLVTTWPCITEAMYLLGLPGQPALHRQIEAGVFALADLSQPDARRACALMQRYADAPMDFADASLVVAAEVLNVTRILTFDSHFYAYRIHETVPFEVLPYVPPAQAVGAAV